MSRARMRALRVLAAAVLASLPLAGCSPSGRLKVTYDAWELLQIGTPPAESREQPSVGKVSREGHGPAVSLGDLVELHLVTTSFGGSGRRAGEYDDGRGWVWIGFDPSARTDFSVGYNAFAATLIGLRQGSVQTFVANPRSARQGFVGGAGVLPFGDSERYYANKPLARSHRGGYIYADAGPGEDVTRVEITRVCQGRAEQRLITLFDDSPIAVAQDIGRSHETSEPRWMYLREARWEGQCNDGAHASFQYGPVIVEPPPGKTKGLNISELWGPWIKEAWSKVPIGVVVK